MIAINKKEKDEISQRYPNVHMVRTMRADSKRHHYYMEEAPGPMRLLKKLRYGIEEAPRKRGRNRYDNRKTAR